MARIKPSSSIPVKIPVAPPIAKPPTSPRLRSFSAMNFATVNGAPPAPNWNTKPSLMMPAWSRNSPANSAILIWIGFLVKPTAPEAIPSGSPMLSTGTT